MSDPEIHTCLADKVAPLQKFRLQLAKRMKEDLDVGWSKIWNEERILEHCVTLSSKDTNDLEKYFICEICGKVFTPASNLWKHIVTTVGRNH